MRIIVKLRHIILIGEVIHLGYKSLDKLFYSDKENYEKIYNERYKSEYAVHLDFLIHDNPAFFVMIPEFITKIRDIYKTDKQIKALRDSLPEKAIGHFAIRCLVDEIVKTKKLTVSCQNWKQRAMGSVLWGLCKNILCCKKMKLCPLTPAKISATCTMI